MSDWWITAVVCVVLGDEPDCARLVIRGWDSEAECRASLPHVEANLGHQLSEAGWPAAEIRGIYCASHGMVM